MTVDHTDGSRVAHQVVAALRPALVVGADTTVGELRRRLLEPAAPTTVVVADPDPRPVDALAAIRSELPDDAPATTLVCCGGPVLEVGDDLDHLAGVLLARDGDHQGHDLVVETDRGVMLLPAAALTRIVLDESALARQLDTLTGLPNRASLQAALEEALQDDPESVAVAFIDLDRFKAINDLHGHGVGDRVLQVIGRRLRNAVRAGDLVGRVGGDEFAAVLRVTGPAEARQAAERFLERLAEPVEQMTNMVTVSASIGVALGPRTLTGGDAPRLVADADSLMYLAKQRGGGVLVAGDLTDVVVTRSQLAAVLAADALELQYQPIVPLDGSPARAVEALVRWPTPDGGTLTPMAFVPLAEATGQILDLDWWALQKAIHQIVAWDASERDDTPQEVHVNLSALTLSMPGLVSHVRRLLGMAGVDPSRLTLEVTETAVVTDLARAKDVLNALAELGVRVAIDDFGVGRSSLTQLSQLPVSALKIDRAFIGRLAQNEIDRSVVRIVRALADELALDVIAEGVESMAQAIALMDLGITHAQGWLWSKAVDARTLGDDTPEAPQRLMPATSQWHEDDELAGSRIVLVDTLEGDLRSAEVASGAPGVAAAPAQPAPATPALEPPPVEATPTGWQATSASVPVVEPVPDPADEPDEVDGTEADVPPPPRPATRRRPAGAGRAEAAAEFAALAAQAQPRQQEPPEAD